MNNLIIVGAGGFGRELLQWAKDINKVEKKWIIKGFIDDTLEKAWQVLMLQIAAGLILYIGLARMFKIESFDYLLKTIKEMGKARTLKPSK